MHLHALLRACERERKHAHNIYSLDEMQLELEGEIRATAARLRGGDVGHRSSYINSNRDSNVNCDIKNSNIIINGSGNRNSNSYDSNRYINGDRNPRKPQAPPLVLALPLGSVSPSTRASKALNSTGTSAGAPHTQSAGAPSAGASTSTSARAHHHRANRVGVAGAHEHAHRGRRTAVSAAPMAAGSSILTLG